MNHPKSDELLKPSGQLPKQRRSSSASIRARKRRSAHRSRLRRFVALGAAVAIATPVAAVSSLRVVDPPITMVQVHRCIQYPEEQRHYRFVPLDRISDHLADAVIASEDARFFEHGGLDWIEIENALEDNLRGGPLRGASTITQQLVRNLFLTTQRSLLRKVAEAPLALLAELLLSKRRILELYLNVVEWGPGVYGAEAAARHHYGVSAGDLTVEEGARLAAVLPSPRKWRPERMDEAARRIRGRMRPRR